MSEESEFLRQVPFFAEMEPSRLRLLAFVSDRVAFDAGRRLFAQGEPADAAYLIMKGCAEIILETAEGGPVLLATVGAHEFVGEMGILCDMPRTATVRAKKPLIALRISKDVFERMVQACPEMALSIMRTLTRRLDAMNRQVSNANLEHSQTGEARQ